MGLESTIKKIIDFAVQVAEPEEIILFGSMATATSNVYSDIDILIILDNGIDNEECISRIQNCAREFALKIDVLILSLAAYEREKGIPNSIVKTVEKLGITMYKKTRTKVGH